MWIALSLDELMMKMRELIERVRAGRIRSSEIADPTITVSSLGERGVETLYGIIYPPQVAIVGFGKVATRPWVERGNVVARPVVNATLAADHRVSDGHAGALFLAEIGKLLQEPGDAVSTVDIRAVVQEELGNIAPEMDVGAIDPSADLREALDIDSMDFLNFVTAMHRTARHRRARDRLSQAHHA